MALTIGSIPSDLPSALSAMDIQSATITHRVRLTEYYKLSDSAEVATKPFETAMVKQNIEGRATVYGEQTSITVGSGTLTGDGIFVEITHTHSANEPDRTEFTWNKQES